MKVLLYMNFGPAGVKGGIETSTEYLIQALQSLGIEVTLNPNDDYDLLDIHMFTPGAKKVLKQARKKGKPVIMHGHSTLADYRHSFRFWKTVIKVFFKPCCYWLYAHSDRIVAVSEFAKHILEPDFIYKKIPIDVCPNALNINEFVYNKTDVQAFENYFNIQPDEKVVINAGLPFDRKGIVDFIEVAKKMPEVKFIWFGTQPKFFTERKILKAIKNKPDNVIMPGYMRNNIFKGALHRANCIFYPSFVETDGMVMLEAFASKTPLLVRDISVFNYLQNGIHCYKGYTNEDFINQLNYIFTHDNQQIIENGYKYVVENRSFEVIGNKLKAIYEQVLNQNK